MMKRYRECDTVDGGKMVYLENVLIPESNLQYNFIKVLLKHKLF